MNALDFIVIGIVVLSGLLAFARGFVKELLSIVGWLGATAAALYAAPALRPSAERFLPKGAVADTAAAGVVFLLTLIVLSIITSRISRQVKRSSLSALDRTLGLVFGLMRGALLVCIGFIALSYVLPPGSDEPRWMAESRTLPLVESTANSMVRLVPEPYRKRAAQLTPKTTLDADDLNAILRAYSLPGSHAAPGGATPGSAAPGGAPPGSAPDYTAEERQGMTRLIQQLGVPQPRGE